MATMYDIDELQQQLIEAQALITKLEAQHKADAAWIAQLLDERRKYLDGYIAVWWEWHKGLRQLRKERDEARTELRRLQQEQI